MQVLAAGTREAADVAARSVDWSTVEDDSPRCDLLLLVVGSDDLTTWRPNIEARIGRYQASGSVGKMVPLLSTNSGLQVTGTVGGLPTVELDCTRLPELRRIAGELTKIALSVDGSSYQALDQGATPGPMFVPGHPSSFASWLVPLSENRVPPELALATPHSSRLRAYDLFEDYFYLTFSSYFRLRGEQFGKDVRGRHAADGYFQIRRDDPFVFLYDCKAAGAGYEFSHDDILRFASYIKKMNQRLRDDLNLTVKHFVVVSSRFANSSSSLDARSRALYEESGVRLALWETPDIRSFVNSLDRAHVRPIHLETINWSVILTAGRLDEKTRNQACSQLTERHRYKF